ncbi:hypothetical protein MAR_020250, partial [Mya arenaria]
MNQKERTSFCKPWQQLFQIRTRKVETARRKVVTGRRKIDTKKKKTNII